MIIRQEVDYQDCSVRSPLLRWEICADSGRANDVRGIPGNPEKSVENRPLVLALDPFRTAELKISPQYSLRISAVKPVGFVGLISGSG